MQLYRLYAGPDGQSHFERLEGAKVQPFFNETKPANGHLFRDDYAPHIVNFHRAPRRRWVVTLAGSVEIAVGDGTAVTFHPGDVFLAEDTTGQGHTAKPKNWIRLYVNLE